MRLGIITALIGIALFSLGMLGCSSDSKTAAPITYGSNDDPVFVPVQTQINDALINAFDNLHTGFSNLSSYPGDTNTVSNQLTPPLHGPGNPPESLITTYSGGWYCVYAIKSYSDYTARVRDSIEYLVDGTPIQGPSSSVDQVNYITNWIFTSTNQAATHIDLAGRSDFNVAGLDQTIATVNGSSTRLVESVYIDHDTTVTNTYNFALTAANLTIGKNVVGWVSNCPTSGTVTLTVGHVYTWNRAGNFGTGSNNWTISVSLNNGTATVTANNGTTTWQYTTELCSTVG